MTNRIYIRFCSHEILFKPHDPVAVDGSQTQHGFFLIMTINYKTKYVVLNIPPSINFVSTISLSCRDFRKISLISSAEAS